MVLLPSLRHFSLSDVFTPVLSIFLHLSTVWLLSPLPLWMPVSWCFLFDIIGALVQAPSYHHSSCLSWAMYMRILLDMFSLLCIIPWPPSNYLTIPFILLRLWVESWQFLWLRDLHFILLKVSLSLFESTSFPSKSSVLPTVQLRHFIGLELSLQWYESAYSSLKFSALPSAQAGSLHFICPFGDSNQRPLALKPSTLSSVLARLRWGYGAKFKYSLLGWWMPPLRKKKKKGVCQAGSLEISCI